MIPILRKVLCSAGVVAHAISKRPHGVVADVYTGTQDAAAAVVFVVDDVNIVVVAVVVVVVVVVAAAVCCCCCLLLLLLFALLLMWSAVFAVRRWSTRMRRGD